MSENEMSQKKDEAAIASARKLQTAGYTLGNVARYIETLGAAFRTIDRLRDELARAYTDLADMHEGEGYHNDAKRYRARAALASADRDGAGTAAGDATAGDGDGGAE